MKTGLADKRVTNMKRHKMTFGIAVLLVLVLGPLSSCKRNAVEQPDPLGPSSMAVILNLSASPNVLFAGLLERQATTITAVLKKFDGTPLADRTVFFEVVDDTGARVDIGHFDDSLTVLSKSTDSSGTASTSYFGPLQAEITANSTLYIRATVSWDGSQFIFDSTPLIIVREAAEQITFIVTAAPDVLFAGATEVTSTIQAQVLFGSAPAAGVNVYFTLSPADVGRFEGGDNAISATTDAQGFATVTYIAPFRWEIAGDTTVTITATLTQTISEQVQIQIIRQT
jgi:hypothetical protein